MADYYMIHSGILGQKWGHKNGPPYPLKASQHSTSEKKAGIKGWSAKAKAQVSKKSDSHEGSKIDKAAVKKATITTLKVGAAAAGVALAAYGGYKLASTGQLSKAVTAGKKALSKTTVIAKESAKNAGKRFVEGIPQGAGDAGNKLGKAVGFTITALAAKEVMDFVLGEDTYKVISSTYNSNHKKDKINYGKSKIEKEDEEDDE